MKLGRVGGVPAVDTSASTHDKRAGIGAIQLDTQLEELRNLQVTFHMFCVRLTKFCFARVLEKTLARLF